MDDSWLDQTGKALVRFLRAEDWSAKRQVLDANPDIASEYGLFVLHSLAADPVSAVRTYPGLDETMALRIMRLHYGLLARCAEVGADRAFAEVKSRRSSMVVGAEELWGAPIASRPEGPGGADKPPRPRR